MKIAETKEKARRIHQHTTRIRTFILRGEMTEAAWAGMKNPPTLAQIKALLVLSTLGPCTLKELAGNLGITGPSTSQMVDRLVEAGLVQRDRDVNDRRRVIIELSEDAARRVRMHEKAILGQIEKLIEMLGEETTEKWLEVAEAMSGVLGNLEGKEAAIQ